MSRDEGFFEKRQLDGFSTETPLRAFTMWDAHGNYAVGRGFRPAYKHFAEYLHAIEEKEGWSLVQIVMPPPDKPDREPTMVFRKAAGGTTERARALETENTLLRAALAMSDQPCAYCSLPADEMAKCKSGFPGCARADDAMGCPHLGAALELEELKKKKIGDKDG